MLPAMLLLLRADRQAAPATHGTASADAFSRREQGDQTSTRASWPTVARADSSLNQTLPSPRYRKRGMGRLGRSPRRCPGGDPEIPPAVRLVPRLIPAVDAGMRREGLLRLWLEPEIQTVARSGSRPRSGILSSVITEGDGSDAGHG